MIILSLRSKKDKEHLLKKAKEMEAYAAELVDCLEEAKDSYDEDEEYAERTYYRRSEEREPSFRGRYGYRR